MELNYKDWKDMLVSKTAVSSEDASVTDQYELQYETQYSYEQYILTFSVQEV